MASNTIGTLSIDVLANIANMVSDMGKAQKENEKTTREIKRQWDEAGEHIKGTLEGIAGLLGIGLGVSEIANLGLEAIETSEKLDRMSQALGISKTTLQTMQYVATTTGASLEDAAGAYTKLERAAVQAASGSAQQAEAFRAIGVSATELKDLLRDPEALVQRVTSSLSGMRDGATKTAIEMELLGRGAAQNALFINELGKGFDEAREKARLFGVVLSEEDNKALGEANESLDALQARMVGLGNQIGVALAPALERVSELIVSTLNSEEFRDDLQLLGEGVEFVAEHLDSLVSVLTILGEFKLAQWLVTAAAGAASLAGEAIIAGSVFAELTGGVAAAEVAFAGITVAGEGLLAMLGGLPGVIALVGIGVYELATHQTDAEKSAKALVDAEEILKNVTADSVDGDLARVQSLERTAEAHLKSARSALAQLEAEYALKDAQSGGGFGEDAALAANSYEGLAETIKDLTADIDAQQKALDDQHGRLITAREDMRAFGQSVTDASRAFVAGDVEGNTAKLAAAQEKIHDAAAKMIKDGDDATIVHAEEENALRRLQDAFDRAGKSESDYDANKQKTKQVTDTSTDALLKLQAQVDQLNARFGSPYKKAFDEYNAGIAKLELAARAAYFAGADVTKIIELWNDGEAALGYTLVETNDALDRQTDIVGNLQRELENESRLAGVTGTAHAQLKAVIDAENEARRLYEQHLRDTPDLTQAEVDAINDAVAAHETLNLHLKQQQQFWGDWAQSAISAGDSFASDFARDMVEGGDALEDLGKMAEKVVEEIIAQFMKLAIINPMLNAIFGGSMQAGGMQALPTIMSLFGGGAGAGGGGNAAGSFLSLFTGGGGASTGGSLMQFATSLFGGGSAAAGATSVAGTGVFSNVVGGSASTAAASGSAAAASSWLGTIAAAMPYIAIIAAAMAYDAKLFAQGWQLTDDEVDYMRNRGGLGPLQGFEGPLGGMLGGGKGRIAYTPEAALFSGYTPGMGMTMQADQLFRDIGLSDSWASILSGSSLLTRIFGHKKPELESGKQTIEFGPDGVTGGIDATILSKGGWFSSDKRWTEHSDLAADDEALKAAKAFYDALAREHQQFAEHFNQEAGELLGATFVQEFDKKGKATGKTTSTINGKTYADETEDEFKQRLVDENDLAILDNFDAKLQESVEKYRDDVGTLTEVTQALARAQEMLNDGTHFLSLGADQSMSAVLHLAEGMQTIGESIGQTIQRIEQAQAEYDQFVGQFAAPATYVDDFEAALSNLSQQEQANIARANELARAAGAEGAATEDLVDIHEYAAKQFAQLMDQLEASAQSLAFSLGVTTVGSLSEVDAEIARLEGIAGNSSNAVHGFGGAMETVANQAKNAMDLLLGSLSPLNDEEKLQVALQGLVAGTATKEQVLEIGRRLYASGQQYNDLFAYVTSMPDRVANTRGGGGSSNADTSHRPLTAEESKRLEELKAEREQLAEAERLKQFQTLAQQIAEIAAAKGEDWRQVAAEMKLDIGKFEEGLGGLSDQQTDDYIRGIQEQKDSAGENTRSIVAAIDRLGDRLLGITENGEPAGDNTGHSGHGRPGASGDQVSTDGHSTGNHDLVGAIEDNTHTTRELIDRFDRQMNQGRSPRGMRTAETVL